MAAFHARTVEYEEGRWACQQGRKITDNPHPPDNRASSPYRQWTRGFMAAEREAEED